MLVNKLDVLLFEFAVIKTTFAPAGIFSGAGMSIPPPVIVAFTLAIKAELVHKFNHELAVVGHVTERVLVFNGVEPT